MLEYEMSTVTSLQDGTTLCPVVRCGQDCLLQVECSGVCSKHVSSRQNIVTLQATEKVLWGVQSAVCDFCQVCEMGAFKTRL